MATKAENERLAKLETEVGVIKEDVAEIKTDIKDLVTSLDKKFASKWVERVMAGMVGIVLTAFLGILVAIAFVKPETPVGTVERTTTVTVNTDGTTTEKVVQAGKEVSSKTGPSAPDAAPSVTVINERVPETEANTNNNESQGAISSLLDMIL